MSLSNPYDNLALALAIAACVLRFYDKTYWCNFVSSFSLLASVLGQWSAHRRARRCGAESPAP